ncbi:hypothetical protein D9M68_240040 [compost metagenome]
MGARLHSQGQLGFHRGDRRLWPGCHGAAGHQARFVSRSNGDPAAGLQPGDARGQGRVLRTGPGAEDEDLQDHAVGRYPVPDVAGDNREPGASSATVIPRRPSGVRGSAALHPARRAHGQDQPAGFDRLSADLHGVPQWPLQGRGDIGALRLLRWGLSLGRQPDPAAVPCATGGYLQPGLLRADPHMAAGQRQAQVRHPHLQQPG